MSDRTVTPSDQRMPPADRIRLEALRYAVNDEAAQYIAIMRVFTTGLTGMLSDQSASEVGEAITRQGFELDLDMVDARLSYLVEHGNLARSPRETEARTLADYLRNRARYQLTQRGELVQRQVEELLGQTDSAREVSTEMLDGILDGLTRLDAYTDTTLGQTTPEQVSREIGTVFAQFEQLVESTRDFYAYLTQVLARFDLERDEFQAFKSVLLDYLQRFVEDIARHMPQIAELLLALGPRVDSLVGRANEGERLVDAQGRRARRGPGLSTEDWRGMQTWFVGDGRRESDAAGVRTLAARAMRSLLTNLRRIATAGDIEHGRYADLVRLANWFDQSEDDTAHALWAAAFGLYPCRHLGLVADDDERPVLPTTSWWTGPAAEVPVMLREQGARHVVGRTGRREDFTAAKAARLAEREGAERDRLAGLAEIAGHRGRLDLVRVSDGARELLMEMYATSLATADRQAGLNGTTVPGTALRLSIRDTPGRGTVLVSPSGRLELVGRTLEIGVEPAELASGS